MMCQVHTGAYVSLLAPGKTDYYTACHPRKTTTYILHIVHIPTHTHDRRKSIRKKGTTKRKNIIKEREDKKAKNEERKERKDKKRRDKKKQDTKHGWLSLVRPLGAGIQIRMAP